MKSRKAYRRKKTPDPEAEVEVASEEIEASPSSGQRLDPGQMAQLIVDMRNGAVDREAASSLAQPMTELAKAFAVQAEVLKAVHDGQKTLRDAIDDDRKTDVVVNSTNALNDTFRGMRGVQQKLLDELASNKRKEWRTRLLYVAAGVIVVLGVVWTYDSFIREQASTLQTSHARITGLESDFGKKLDELEGNLVGMRDELSPQFQPLLDEALDETHRLRDANSIQLEELQRLRVEVEALRGNRDEVSELRAADVERTREMATLQAKNERLEEQLGFYMSKYEESTARIEKLQEDVIASIRNAGSTDWVNDLESAGSRQDSALSVVTPDGPGGTLPTGSPVPEASSAPAPRKDEAAADGRDPRVAEIAAQQLEDVRKRLNGLMAAHKSSHTFRIDRLGAIRTSHLEDVVVVEVAPGRGIVKEITADKLTFVVSALGDQVELEFEDGSTRVKKSSLGLASPTPFYKGRYRQTIICTNGDNWLALSEGYVLVD